MNIIQAIRAVAKKFPDKVYIKKHITDNCHYHRTKSNNNMGCIIGEALRLIKVPYNMAWEDYSASYILNGLYNERAIDKPTENEIRWIDVVQDQQDDHLTWSEAINEADNKYPGE